ncbi:MAG: hypothetical protein WCR55_14040 [Lentisphaerota bacterium]
MDNKLSFASDNTQNKAEFANPDDIRKLCPLNHYLDNKELCNKDCSTVKNNTEFAGINELLKVCPLSDYIVKKGLLKEYPKPKDNAEFAAAEDIQKLCQTSKTDSKK